MRPIFPGGRRARVAIFVSGSGTNAREILKAHAALGEASPIQPVAIVTDRPDDPGCRAREIARDAGLALAAADIARFHRERNVARVTLRTVEGRRAREAWTGALREAIAPLRPDIGVLAGFVPLTNLVRDFPCLNVHPGDLTVLVVGRRHLVGLHTVPIERAILLGHASLRSSVILATPYEGEGEGMDAGPVLGISEPVPIDFMGHAIEDLRGAARIRPARRPAGGYGDVLERVAEHNQERLKRDGDWVVFPQVLFDCARGILALDGERVCLIDGGGGRPVERIVYGRAGRSVRYADGVPGEPPP
ncbi:MAG: hypothetical protein JXP34_27395 [Planctomycetes bacterium]|nr:hypothetical protein [Planctomycetota bacterium]